MEKIDQAYAVLSIIFGVLIIAFPEVLAWLVGLFLIVSGVMSLGR